MFLNSYPGDSEVQSGLRNPILLGLAPSEDFKGHLLIDTYNQLDMGLMGKWKASFNVVMGNIHFSDWKA